MTDKIIERTVYVLMNLDRPMLVEFTRKDCLAETFEHIVNKAGYEKDRKQGVLKIVRATLTIPHGSYR